MDRMEFQKIIESRQQKVDVDPHKLTFLNNGMSPYYNPNKNGLDLSPGCKCCKNGTWWCLYVGHRCNLDCVYCPQGDAEHKRTLIDHPEAMQRLWIRDIKLSLSMVKPGTIRGISYSGGEPLMFIDKIIDMASFVSDKFPFIYQWCYTNGMLVNEYRLQKLVDAGLSEIRFHIGASLFNDEIINKIPLAVKLFKRVTVETPANPKLKDWAITKFGLNKLQDFGVTQLNCAEHYFINDRARSEYPDTDTYTYTSMARGQHISPTFSRNVTYDIIEYAIQENIDIIINDCNNESRDAQIMTRELNKDRLTQMF